MRVLDGSFRNWDPGGESVLTVGVMDGVHRGHRALLEHVVGGNLIATVATFEPHPVEVLAGVTDPRLITNLAERLELLESVGVEQAAVLDLREIRDFTPEAFVVEILVERLRARRVVAGVDFQFGKNRTGTVAHLNRLGQEHDFEVDVVDLVVDEGVVSSSRIRGLIEDGDVEGAAALLESRYRISGGVIGGDKRGRALGFPTANLAPPPRKVIPGNGVYACWAEYGSGRHQAAVNVGVRPTFDGNGQRLIEAHLIDFEGDLYGKELCVEFAVRLRDELKFESVEALVDQMHHDIETARNALSPR